MNAISENSLSGKETLKKEMKAASRNKSIGILLVAVGLLVGASILAGLLEAIRDFGISGLYYDSIVVFILVFFPLLLLLGLYMWSYYKGKYLRLQKTQKELS